MVARATARSLLRRDALDIPDLDEVTELMAKKFSGMLDLEQSEELQQKSVRDHRPLGWLRAILEAT